MSPHSNAAHNGAASRNSLAACFRDNIIPTTSRMQFLIGTPEARPVNARQPYFRRLAEIL